MKTLHFSDSQIITILKQAEAGSPAPELCREHGTSSATFYKRRTKLGGMDASLMARLRKLEDEIHRLKKMYAKERLKAEIIQEAMAKKVVKPSRMARDGAADCSAWPWHAWCLASVSPAIAISLGCPRKMLRSQIT